MNKLFTLIEMVIVTVVISILTAIVIPNISSLQKEASTSAITSNIRNIQTSVDMYRLENQDTLPVDDVTIFNPKVIDFNKLNPKYLRDMPETKGVTYWIDFRGIVWGSHVDAPKINEVKEGRLSWIAIEGASKYRVYELKNFKTIENIVTKTKLTSMKKVDEIKHEYGKTTFETTKIQEGKVYLISIIDEQGFETAPFGYSDELTKDEEFSEDYYVNVPLNDNLTCTSLKGEGTSENPYKISNANELNSIRNCLTAHFELTANIDLESYNTYNGGKGWIPIGEHTNQFKGIFDGKGYKIKNLLIDYSGVKDTSAYYKGLFGSIGLNSVIKNVSVIESKVIAFNNIGLIAGFSQGIIENVHAQGIIKSNGWTGGVVGYNYSGKVLNSHSKVNISGSGYIGGLVGYNNGLIENSTSTESIIEGYQQVGGLAGLSYNAGTIKKSMSTNNILAIGNTAGGLIGQNYGLVSTSYATGDVTVNYYQAGGLIGLSNGPVTDSYATGNVSGYERVGGLIGSNSNSITNSYSIGTVKGKMYVGGLIGQHSGNLIVSNSYWDMVRSGYVESSAGIGRTTLQMKDTNNYKNWDFNNIWEIEEASYPKIK